MNNSPSNIFQPLPLKERYLQNSQAALVATGINGSNPTLMKHEIGHLNMIGLARNASQSSLAKNVKCDMTWPVGQPMRSCKSCGTDCLCVKRPNKT